MVRTSWSNSSVEGWPSYALTQKLKMLKAKIKEWQRLHYKSNQAAVQKAKAHMVAWDIEAESRDLSFVDCENFATCRRNYFKTESHYSKSVRQKSMGS